LIRARAELEAQHREEKRVAQQLKEKEEDWAGLEQKFSSQQEEIEEKARKLKKLFGKYQAAQTEIVDIQHEF
jgi:chromosome segregation ATPase